jgi:hypothetical protein
LKLEFLAASACVAVPGRGRQRPPASVRDPDPRHVDRLAGREGPLGLGGRELVADDSEDDFERETLRRQERIGAALIAAGEYLK